MELKGIAWDHARGYHPLLAVSEEFEKKYPGTTVSWDKRSLKDFGDYPISRLIDTYDLIVVDHPFMAESLRDHLLLTLDDRIDSSYLEMLRREAIGASFDCYCVAGKLQALPIDVACQVAASNREVFARKHLPVPVTLEEVFALKQEMGTEYSIGFPFWATDLACIFYGLVAQQRGKRYFDLQSGIDEQAGAAAAALLQRMVEIAQPDAFEMSPISLFDEMSEHDGIIYAPYGFGYTNYSREGYRRNLLEFHDAPLIRRDAEVSTVLGGVGIAVSGEISREKVGPAIEYIKFLASPEIQRGIFTRADGQPAAVSAWLDGENNRLTHQFFRNTLRTHRTAFVRPQIPEWPYFHTEVGLQLQRDLRNRLEPERIARRTNELYRELCVKDGF